MKKRGKVESALRFRSDDFRRKSFGLRHVMRYFFSTFFMSNKEDERDSRSQGGIDNGGSEMLYCKNNSNKERQG